MGAISEDDLIARFFAPIAGPGALGLKGVYLDGPGLSPMVGARSEPVSLIDRGSSQWCAPGLSRLNNWGGRGVCV